MAHIHINKGYVMKIPKRDYNFRGADTDKESKMFWIVTVIGVALAILIIVFLGR